MGLKDRIVAAHIAVQQKEAAKVAAKTSWKQEWVGMPEFVQEKQVPHAKIIFRFETENDLREFSKLVGQPLTSKTKSAWYPPLERGVNTGKRWVDTDETTTPIARGAPVRKVKK